MAVVVTPAPLPRLWAAGRSRVAAQLACEARLRGSLAWFPRGAWALAAAAAALTPRRPGRPVVFVPDYFCNSSLGPLRGVAQVVFYPIDSGLAPQWTTLDGLAADTPPDLLVLVHYFGFPGPAASAAAWCERHGARLVEDAAHVLRPVAGIGGIGWATLFSPHKLWAVPEVGVLVVHDPPPVRDAAAPVRPIWRTGTWLARKTVQTALVALGIPWPRAKPEFAADQPESGGAVTGQLRGARWWVASAERDLEWAAAARRRAYHRLADATAASGAAARVLVAANTGEAAPYLFAARVPEDAAPRLFRATGAAGLPVGTWPDLPPEVAGHPMSEACRLRASVITLPVHHSLSDRQISWMADTWCEALRAIR